MILRRQGSRSRRTALPSRPDGSGEPSYRRSRSCRTALLSRPDGSGEPSYRRISLAGVIGDLSVIRRRGFTVLECVVALAVLAFALTLVAEVAVWSLRERGRSARRQDALEAAMNVLESVRARPWNELTPEWAQAQRLPEELAQELLGGRLTVQVEKEASRPHTKRVTVEIQWEPEEGGPARPIRLVSLFSARSAEKKGVTP